MGTDTPLPPTSRLLHLVASSRGGGATHVRDLAMGLDPTRFAVQVAMPEDGGSVRREDFEAAGGTRALMKQLEGFLNKDATTVTGQTVGEILRDTTVADEEIIRPVQRALATRPSIVIVRGSLAPETAISDHCNLPGQTCPVKCENKMGSPSKAWAAL